MKTADESYSSILAQLSAAHPALTIVNEFSLTKEGCPAARPHRAPPRSTGPWTRHSKPAFSIFQCGQEPAGFIGVFKSYSLKHSSSVSTHSRQFPFYSLPHFVFISRSPLSLSLSLFQNCFPVPPFSLFPLILRLIPRAHCYGSVWRNFLLTPLIQKMNTANANASFNHIKFSSFLILH